MASDLPKWVWDLVVALQQYEDEHGDATSCLAPVLALVPADIGHDADAIRRYAALAGADASAKDAGEQWTGLVDSPTAAREPTP